MSRKQIIAGNWKMNGSINETQHFLDMLLEQNLNTNNEIVICPPFSLLYLFKQKLQDSKFAIGGQDCHFETKGSFTGDISPNMLVDMSCKYVILGHSERRIKHYETNYLISKKVSSAHNAGLSTILCVGESKADKDENKTKEVISKQVKFSLPSKFTSDNLIIAYEPVWSIGTGNVPSNEEIVEVIKSIKETLISLSNEEIGNNIKILYGGSVNASNSKEILSLENVDGALVGGASLVCEDFISIINNTKQ